VSIAKICWNSNFAHRFYRMSSNQDKFNQIMGDAWNGGNLERELQNIVE